jgi:hypothetical protein
VVEGVPQHNKREMDILLLVPGLSYLWVCSPNGRLSLAGGASN